MSCKCEIERIIYDEYDEEEWIVYCPLHESVDDLLNALLATRAAVISGNGDFMETAKGLARKAIDKATQS